MQKTNETGWIHATILLTCTLGYFTMAGWVIEEVAFSLSFFYLKEEAAWHQVALSLQVSNSEKERIKESATTISCSFDSVEIKTKDSRGVAKQKFYKAPTLL